jgi:hypothetical protein
VELGDAEHLVPKGWGLRSLATTPSV